MQRPRAIPVTIVATALVLACGAVGAMEARAAPRFSDPEAVVENPPADTAQPNAVRTADGTLYLAVVIRTPGSTPSLEAHSVRLLEVDADTGPKVLWSRDRPVESPSNDDAKPSPPTLRALDLPRVAASGDRLALVWRERIYWEEEPCTADGQGCVPIDVGRNFVVISTDRGRTFSAPASVSTPEDPYWNQVAADAAFGSDFLLVGWGESNRKTGSFRVKMRPLPLTPGPALAAPQLVTLETASERIGTLDFYGPRLVHDAPTNRTVVCWGDGQGTDASVWCRVADGPLSDGLGPARSLAADAGGTIGFFDLALDGTGGLLFVFSRADASEILAAPGLITTAEQDGPVLRLLRPTRVPTASADPARRYAPQLSLDAGGRLGVVWLEPPGDDGGPIGVGWAHSLDRGVTWNAAGHLGQPLAERGFGLFSTAARSLELIPDGEAGLRLLFLGKPAGSSIALWEVHSIEGSRHLDGSSSAAVLTAVR